MGPQSKEGVQLNRKSERIGRRGGGGGGNPDGDRTTVLLRHDKSLIPNYLKPTISSCGSNICQYPTSQQLPGPCPGRKSVIAKAPLSSFSPSPKVKEKEKEKERSIHNVSSFLSKPSKPVSSDKLAPKPSPLIKNVMNALPKLRKSTRKRNLMSKETRSGTSKRREGNKVDIISSSSARKKKAEVNNDNDNDNGEKHEVIEYEGSKNSGETKPRTPTRAKATSLSDEDEIKMVVKSEEFGNREDEKERSRCCNKVIAETIKRQVAERRRNNVRALVGAFETVISLESQLSTHKGEETKFTTIITRARARARARARKDFESRIGGQHNHEEEENRRETDDGDKEGKHENLEDDQIGQQEETKVEVFVEGQQSGEEEEEEEESKTEANQWTTESDKEDEVIESKSNTTEKNNDENKLFFSTEVKAIESVDN